ncbi:glycosyltransferase [Marinobacter sp. S6332]|uniref:glycosyltransferase n=1 Tax=Marinobacter sp. S6332 TaxID=2926403 RepID=UPI001FF3EDBC|nr:glycosyltransferase [Marinobacter sp. S6332]MCK0163958.1 glycosyltransferase [Marinobacter sp. S6332]
MPTSDSALHFSTLHFDSTLHFIVPGDPNQNTGGYRYVRKLVEALNEAGTKAMVTGVPGAFPKPDAIAIQAMDNLLVKLEEGSRVILDGLAMSAMPEVLAKHTHRLRLIALIHHPLADETGLNKSEQDWFFEREKLALATVGGVFTTSAFTAYRLADYGVAPERIRTAEPGVENPVGNVLPTISEALGGTQKARVPHILCVAHLSPRKAQHHLVQALAQLDDLLWHCTLAGSCERDSTYANTVQKQIDELGLNARIDLAGEVDAQRLASLYQSADVFVLPSLYEGYGMVIDEAIAAGLPVISSDGGALKNTSARPGVRLYRAGDTSALQANLKAWLGDPVALAQARALAENESSNVMSWADTASLLLKGLSYFEQRHCGETYFADEWLQAREAADHDARSVELTQRLDRWVSERISGNSDREGPIRILDIGTGRGSNVVYLAPALPMPQEWMLVDQDESLLREASHRAHQLKLACETQQRRILPKDFRELISSNTDVVTASALIDLVSELWLAALVDEVTSKHVAILIVLSYTGNFVLSPTHKYDSRLQALVNQHQHGDKGTGAALGPDAAARFAHKLKAKGYEVHVADTPWQLTGKDAKLAEMLMAGWVTAAKQQSSEASEQLDEWFATRKRQLLAGVLKITVPHQDVLGLPSSHFPDTAPNQTQ